SELTALSLRHLNVTIRTTGTFRLPAGARRRWTGPPSAAPAGHSKREPSRSCPLPLHHRDIVAAEGHRTNARRAFVGGRVAAAWRFGLAGLMMRHCKDDGAAHVDAPSSTLRSQIGGSGASSSRALEYVAYW